MEKAFQENIEDRDSSELGSPPLDASFKKDNLLDSLSQKDEEILLLRKRVQDQQEELHSKSIQLALLQEQLQQQKECKLRTHYSRVPSDDFFRLATEHEESNEDWGFFVSEDPKKDETLRRVTNKILCDRQGDGGVYTGLVLKSTGLPHGFGKMVYDEEKRIYDGDWHHGRWHGFGRADFADGDSYEGEYRFDQRHGEGKYVWSDGRVYEGMFKDDKKHGRGTLSWPEGAIYKGEFNNGLRDGWGSYKLVQKDQCLESYTGEWKYGQYNGYGTCLWENGQCYEGEWRDGMAHGKGVETYADGTIRHQGQWMNDEPIVDQQLLAWNDEDYFNVRNCIT